MANLIEYIQSQIYENSTEDISGSIMQQVLTRMASDEGVVNVHTISGQTPFADYNNAQAARDAVPAGFKKLGLVITYKLSSGWYVDEFIGSATSGWSTASNWKCLGPISVSQNASTGKTTITIGSQSYDVATQPVSVSQNTLSIGGNYAGEMSTTYDVTLHSGQTFASLSELLSDANLNTLIPLVVRKGGMNIKFVQTSDNNYVRYNLKANSFTTDVTQWEPDDLEIITGSAYISEFTSQYQIKNLSTPWPEGTIVKNLPGSIAVYLYGNDASGAINPGQTKVLDREVTQVKSDSAGTANIIVGGKLNDLYKELADEKTRAQTAENNLANDINGIEGIKYTEEFTSQYQTKHLTTAWPSGTIIKNLSDSIAVYIYGNDASGLIKRNEVRVLDRNVTEVKSGSVGTANIIVGGELNGVRKEVADEKTRATEAEEDLASDIENITGTTYTENFTSQYQVKNVTPPWPAGTTIKNVGTVWLYLNGTDLLKPNDKKTLESNVTSLKSGGVGTAKVKLCGELDFLHDELEDDISDVNDSIVGINYSEEFTSLYQIKNLSTSWPEGTVVKNKKNSIYVYLYGQDGTGILRPGEVRVLDREVTQVKSGSIGTANIIVGGELNDVRKDISDLEKSVDEKITEVETDVFSARIFMKVGCIGDSFTSGHIQLPDGPVYASNPNYAWPHYAESITNNTWVNFGVGGSSAKAWVNGLFASQGIASQGNKCQAYVIGLGINDQADWNPDKVDAGTAEDIGTDNNTFTAWYYKLVQLVVGVNADAKIFLNTEPRYGASNAYNQAIVNVAEYCKEELGQNVYLCDLVQYNNVVFWNNPVFLADMTNGHHTPLGYQFMAQCYTKIMSDVINNNQAEFKDVFLIPYDS